MYSSCLYPHPQRSKVVSIGESRERRSWLEDRVWQQLALIGKKEGKTAREVAKDILIEGIEARREVMVKQAEAEIVNLSALLEDLGHEFDQPGPPVPLQVVPEPPVSPPEPVPAVEAPHPRMSLRAAVRGVLDGDHDREWNTKQVTAYLKAMDPDIRIENIYHRVNNTLWNLRENGEAIKVRRGVYAHPTYVSTQPVFSL